MKRVASNWHSSSGTQKGIKIAGIVGMALSFTPLSIVGIGLMTVTGAVSGGINTRDAVKTHNKTQEAMSILSIFTSVGMLGSAGLFAGATRAAKLAERSEGFAINAQKMVDRQAKRYEELTTKMNELNPENRKVPSGTILSPEHDKVVRQRDLAWAKQSTAEQNMHFNNWNASKFRDNAEKLKFAGKSVSVGVAVVSAGIGASSVGIGIKTHNNRDTVQGLLQIGLSVGIGLHMRTPSKTGIAAPLDTASDAPIHVAGDLPPEVHVSPVQIPEHVIAETPDPRPSISAHETEIAPAAGTPIVSAEPSIRLSSAAPPPTDEAVAAPRSSLSARSSFSAPSSSDVHYNYENPYDARPSDTTFFGYADAHMYEDENTGDGYFPRARTAATILNIAWHGLLYSRGIDY